MGIREDARRVSRPGRFGLALLSAVAALGLAQAPAAGAAEPLTVCLEEDSPPYSFKFRSRRGGFDLAVAGAVAAKLGRELRVQWFENELDEDAVPMWEASALLSAGLCDLIGGYVLMATMLGQPVQARGALPDHEGGRGGFRGPRVELRAIAASRPYHRAALAVILGADAGERKIGGLEDLAGLRIGAEVSSLASAILVSHGGGELVPDLSHVAPTKGLLRRMEEGEFQATLFEIHRFDWYRRNHADTKLRASGYYHPLGYNFGFAALEGSAELLARVNTALEALGRTGEIERLALESGLTFIPPAEPAIAPPVTPLTLLGG